MSLKALMVDVDGVVVVRPPDPAKALWNWNAKAELGLDPEAFQSEFFSIHWDDVVHGRADLHERLTPVLQRIAPGLTSHQVVDYWFANDAFVDHALLADLRDWRSRGVELHLATVQEHHRARYLMSDLKLGETFQAIHYSAAYGFSKPDAAFFRAVCGRTGFEPQDLVLIDDRPKNIEAARACGWGGVLWDGTLSLDEALAEAGVVL